VKKLCIKTLLAAIIDFCLRILVTTCLKGKGRWENEVVVIVNQRKGNKYGWMLS
jgi:hypothetical protein